MGLPFRLSVSPGAKSTSFDLKGNAKPLIPLERTLKWWFGPRGKGVYSLVRELVAVSTVKPFYSKSLMLSTSFVTGSRFDCEA